MSGRPREPWSRALVPEVGRRWNVDFRDLCGITISDLTKDDACGLLAELIERYDGPCRVVLFAHTNTLTHALKDECFTGIINSADFLFGDGTGVRWAFSLSRSRIPKDNVNGTDLVPRLLGRTRNPGYRYFLLGGGEEMIRRSAAGARTLFPACEIVGYHHGYVAVAEDDSLVDRINAAEPHLLLVGMGSPLQEQWIARNRHRLRVPLVLSVGGLFSYWAGELKRAPAWFRRSGIEWVYVLGQQPWKWRRYLLDAPILLARICLGRRAGNAVREDGKRC